MDLIQLIVFGCQLRPHPVSHPQSPALPLDTYSLLDHFSWELFLQPASQPAKEEPFEETGSFSFWFTMSL